MWQRMEIRFQTITAPQTDSRWSINCVFLQATETVQCAKCSGTHTGGVQVQGYVCCWPNNTQQHNVLVVPNLWHFISVRAPHLAAILPPHISWLFIRTPLPCPFVRWPRTNNPPSRHISTMYFPQSPILASYHLRSYGPANMELEDNIIIATKRWT